MVRSPLSHFHPRPNDYDYVDAPPALITISSSLSHTKNAYCLSHTYVYPQIAPYFLVFSLTHHSPCFYRFFLLPPVAAPPAAVAEGVGVSSGTSSIPAVLFHPNTRTRCISGILGMIPNNTYTGALTAK